MPFDGYMIEPGHIREFQHLRDRERGLDGCRPIQMHDPRSCEQMASQFGECEAQPIPDQVIHEGETSRGLHLTKEMNRFSFIEVM